MQPARRADSTRVDRSGRAPSPGVARARQGQSNLAMVRAFVDCHYAKPLTIDRLAGRARLSSFHFIRAFRAAYGETPHQYLRGKRLERARELLVTTPLPITEICDQVGFQSLGSFSSLFRRLTGETPAKYRAARRKNVYIPSCFIRMYRADR
jgi:transcriptional regulator GlxA family with amidase domain